MHPVRCLLKSQVKSEIKQQRREQAVAIVVVVVVVVVYFILSRLLFLAFSAYLGLLCMPHPGMAPLV